MTDEIIAEYAEEAKKITQTVKSMFEKQAEAARVSDSIDKRSWNSSSSGAVEPGTL